MNLKNLAQDGPVDDYIAKFRILANSSGITQEEALIEFFLDGLKEDILKGIFGMLELPKKLADYYAAASRFEQQQTRYKTLAGNVKKRMGSTASIKDEKVKEEKQIMRLTPTERSNYALCVINRDI